MAAIKVKGIVQTPSFLAAPDRRLAHIKVIIQSRNLENRHAGWNHRRWLHELDTLLGVSAKRNC